MNGTKECDLSVWENSSTVSMLCQIDDYQQAEIEACREKWNNLHNKLEDWVTCGQDTNILREIIRTEINCRSKAYGIDCAT